ncbi:MAG: hypothetical protein PHZ25_01390 [Candidatus Pacebacteria bacterium]|nr:hypothetical protein [Candidatus Paceibacterota bacterium]
MAWYFEYGYTPFLPKNISLKSSEQEIFDTISNEYNEEKYAKISSSIKKIYNSKRIELCFAIQEVFQIKLPEKIFIYITKYGMGGSYNPPSIVVYNLHNKNGEQIIFHEIMHLIIESDAQKWGLHQFEKERTVDLILHSKKFSFLNYTLWQKDYQKTEQYIDELFHLYFYHSPEKYFQMIKSRRK